MRRKKGLDFPGSLPVQSPFQTMKPEKLKFLFAIHCHQPVGNFEHVFEQCFKDCYRPLIETLARHPKTKCSLHYSGQRS